MRPVEYWNTIVHGQLQKPTKIMSKFSDKHLWYPDDGVERWIYVLEHFLQNFVVTRQSVFQLNLTETTVVWTKFVHATDNVPTNGQLLSPVADRTVAVTTPRDWTPTMHHRLRVSESCSEQTFLVSHSVRKVKLSVCFFINHIRRP